jgi:uncharacterized repeat protein (TIGR01451 family)
MNVLNHSQTLAVSLRVGIFVTLFSGSVLAGFAAGPEKISDSAAQQIRALEQEKSSRSPLHRKLDSQFVFKLKQNLNQIIAPGVTQLQPDIKFEPDGRILVDIEANVTQGLLAQIKQSGGTVVNSFPQYHAIRALLPLNQLENLAGLAEVKFIGRARRAQTNTGSVDSEGDVTHRANTARSTFGVSGQGVKVGVLSDSIDYLAASQASGDLGPVTVLPGQGGSGAGEGTAMLEIIHDLAPGAPLYFATAVNGEASFAQNILDLRSNGCDIIVDDVGYFDESPFQDGIIAQAVNSVTASGALYFSAAGNDGNLKDHTSCTWEGDFVDGGPAVPPENIGGGHIHSFGSSTYDTVITPGNGIDLFWSDPLGGSSNDYDLFVLDPTGTYVVASSTNPQDGTQDPYEEVYSVSAGDRIVIVKTTGDARYLHLDTSRGSLGLKTTGATRGHSAAAAAFSVAAVDALDSFPSPFSGGSQDPVETFSSDGPRRVFYNANGTPITPGNYSSTGGVVRQKPDIAAADGVMTYVWGVYLDIGRFYGTSAAAPHAAAIAALLLSYNHGLTPGQIRTTLTNTALDIEDPGIDANSGAGIVMAYQALQSLPPEPVLVPGGMSLLNESCPNGAIDPGETVTVALTITNIGLGNTTNLTATLLSTGGVTSPSASQNYGSLAGGGGTASKMFTFIAAGNCGDTNMATLQLQDGSNNLGTVSFAFQLGNPRAPLSENFDEVTPPALPPGWTTSGGGSGTQWSTTTNASDTPPNSAFVPDAYGSSQWALMTPVFPIVTTNAQLTFRQSMDTDYYGYDGGVLEISINGGAFVDILAAGGSFVMNGYNTTLYTGYGNLLQGSPAWTGYSGGFVTTIVNLPAAAAGQNVRLAWVFGSSSYYGGYGGWNIDTISVTDGSDCCVPLPNNLVVSVSDSPDPVVLGGNLTYTINVENTGPNSAQGVSLIEVLPPSFSLQSISLSQNVYPGPQANGGSTLNFNLGSLTGGSTATITITGTANSLGLMTNHVAVSRTDPDANTNDNTAMAVTTVILPALSINDVTLFSGNSGTTNAVFTASLWPPPSQSATIQFATSNQTAISGTDYLSTSGTLTFAPGVTNRTIAVPVIGGLLNEPTKTFVVNLSNPTNAVLGRAQGVGTILNDNPLPYLLVSDVTVIENKSGTTNAVFNVSLSAPSGQTVTVYCYTSDGTAIGGTDYLSVNNYLTFNPGQTNQTVSVVVNNHVTAKPSQTFYLNLSSAVNAKIGRNQALGTIVTALPGQLDHLAWSDIASPQSNSVPFGVTISAQDYYNTTVSNFTGPVALSGASVGSQAGITGRSNLVIQTTTTPIGAILNNLGQPYDLVQTGGSLSGIDLSRYNTVIFGMDGGSVAYADMAHLATAVNAGTKLIVLGGTAESPFAQGLNDFFIHINTANYSWTTVGSSPDLSVTLPGHPLAVGLPATYNFLNHSATFYMARVTDSSAVTVAVNGDRYACLSTKPVGAGAVVLFINSPAAGYWSNPSDLAVLSTVISNALLWIQGGGATPVPITPTNSGNFVKGVWSGNITVQQLATNVTLRADDGQGHTGSSNPFDVVRGRGVTTHFVWSTIPSPQSNGLPFGVTISAQDDYNTTVSNFNGIVALSGSYIDMFGTNSMSISPTNSASFTNGVWSGSITLQQLATNVSLRADDGQGHTGTSNPFDVVPGRGVTTHFVWSTIPSPQSNGVPFGVTITAQDYYNTTASNFTGPVALSVPGETANEIFGNLVATISNNGTYTVGFAFTPNTNIVVTAVRSYSGTKVSIWTDTGTLLASQPVSGTAGTWTETPLTTPLTLSAGVTYRVGFYTGGGLYYYIYYGSSFPATFTNGTILGGGSYYTASDAFPTTIDTGNFFLVDLKYILGTQIPVPITPTNSGYFVNGVWSGNITVQQPATNVTLLAEDAQGHTGLSNPFRVINVPPPSGLVINGGFETGDFTGWTLTGDTSYTYVDNGSEFPPHSGSYEAELGTTSSIGYLSQTLATTPGTSYLLSCWLNNSYGDPGNIFIVSWNGTTLLDETNPFASTWTNYQFVVSATGSNTVLQIGFADNGANYLGLDDISVLAAQPGITGMSISGTNLLINGSNGFSGITYYVLMSTNLALPLNQWTPVATNVLNASGDFTISVTNAVNLNVRQSFYILRMP